MKWIINYISFLQSPNNQNTSKIYVLERKRVFIITLHFEMFVSVWNSQRLFPRCWYARTVITINHIELLSFFTKKMQRAKRRGSSANWVETKGTSTTRLQVRAWVPASQLSHELSPTESWNLPSVHESQLVCPTELWYSPNGRYVTVALVSSGIHFISRWTRLCGRNGMTNWQ